MEARPVPSSPPGIAYLANLLAVQWRFFLWGALAAVLAAAFMTIWIGPVFEIAGVVRMRNVLIGPTELAALIDGRFQPPKNYSETFPWSRRPAVLPKFDGGLGILTIRITGRSEREVGTHMADLASYLRTLSENDRSAQAENVEREGKILREELQDLERKLAEYPGEGPSTERLRQAPGGGGTLAKGRVEILIQRRNDIHTQLNNLELRARHQDIVFQPATDAPRRLGYVNAGRAVLTAAVLGGGIALLALVVLDILRARRSGS
jgi:hypothetical protein